MRIGLLILVGVSLALASCDRLRIFEQKPTEQDVQGVYEPAADTHDELKSPAFRERMPAIVIGKDGTFQMRDIKQKWLDNRDGDGFVTADGNWTVRAHHSNWIVVLEFREVQAFGPIVWFFSRKENGFWILEQNWSPRKVTFQRIGPPPG